MRKLHPRHYPVAKAGSELTTFVLSLVEKHGLTWGETTRILAEELALLAKYQIREERHGDDGYPGDIE